MKFQNFKLKIIEKIGKNAKHENTKVIPYSQRSIGHKR